MTIPEKQPRSVGVHDGTFHADEVTACALLALFNLIDEDKIIRSRNPEELAKCEYVCDVGGVYDPKQKLFDHHQVDYTGPWSSAGMVLNYLKTEKIISEKEYHFFNGTLVIGIDDHDNGRAPLPKGYCSFSHVISNFVPVQHDCSAEEQYSCFIEGFHFALSHLRRIWERYQYVFSCKEKVQKVMAECRDCLIFNESLPWLEGFFELQGEDHPARFVIMPSGPHWKLRGIPPSFEDRMNVRVPLPEEWAGLLEEELQAVSGISGAVFCHKGRFISVWKTKEDAIKALEYTIENSKVGK